MSEDRDLSRISYGQSQKSEFVDNDQEADDLIKFEVVASTNNEVLELLVHIGKMVCPLKILNLE